MKMYRELTGVGLTAAKEAVEATVAHRDRHEPAVRSEPRR
jgi:ribosomal protein L7/L12